MSLGKWNMETVRQVRMAGVLDEVRDEVRKVLSGKIMKIFVSFKLLFHFLLIPTCQTNQKTCCHRQYSEEEEEEK